VKKPDRFLKTWYFRANEHPDVYPPGNPLEISQPAGVGDFLLHWYHRNGGECWFRAVRYDERRDELGGASVDGEAPGVSGKYRLTLSCTADRSSLTATVTSDNPAADDPLAGTWTADGKPPLPDDPPRHERG
jgi:hypothetical protein